METRYVELKNICSLMVSQIMKQVGNGYTRLDAEYVEFEEEEEILHLFINKIRL